MTSRKLHQKLHKGMIVDITIKGVEIQDQHTNGSVSVVANAHDGGPATWHMPPQAEITVIPPDFIHNTAWKDAAGLLWLAQWDPGDDENDSVRLYSSMGDYSIAEALGSHGPFTQVEIPA